MGADLDYHCEEDATTSLHQAVSNGHQDVMRALLEAGANVDEEDNSGATPLHLAARKDMVEMLISAGADLDHEDYAGRTPGRRALDRKNMVVVAALIDGCADRGKIYRMIQDTDDWNISSLANHGLKSLQETADVAGDSYYQDCRLVIGIVSTNHGLCLDAVIVIANAIVIGD